MILIPNAGPRPEPGVDRPTHRKDRSIFVTVFESIVQRHSVRLAVDSAPAGSEDLTRMFKMRKSGRKPLGQFRKRGSDA